MNTRVLPQYRHALDLRVELAGGADGQSGFMTVLLDVGLGLGLSLGNKFAL